MRSSFTASCGGGCPATTRGRTWAACSTCTCAEWPARRRPGSTGRRTVSSRGGLRSSSSRSLSALLDGHERGDRPRRFADDRPRQRRDPRRGDRAAWRSSVQPASSTAATASSRPGSPGSSARRTRRRCSRSPSASAPLERGAAHCTSTQSPGSHRESPPTAPTAPTAPTRRSTTRAPGDVVDLPEPRHWLQAVAGSRLVTSGVLHVDFGTVQLDRYRADERLVADWLDGRSPASLKDVDGHCARHRDLHQRPQRRAGQPPSGPLPRARPRSSLAAPVPARPGPSRRCSGPCVSPTAPHRGSRLLLRRARPLPG